MKRFLCVMMAVMLLALCAGGATAGEAEKTKLVFTTVGTEADHTTPMFKKIVEDFNADNEFGVEVEVQFYENEQYKTKLTTLMAANDIPDIFMTYELEYMEPFVNAGKVADITDYIDDEWRQTFQDGALDLLVYGGRNFGIPTQKSANVVYYNKTMFDSLSLSVPKTFDEFVTVCDTLLENGIVPISISGEGAWRVSQFVQEIAAGIGGMDLYNGIIDGSRKWNDEQNVQSGEIFKTMSDKGYFNKNYMSTLGEEAISIFGRGETAMYYNGIWDVNPVLASEAGQAGDVDVFIFPAVNAQYDGICVGSVNYSFGVGANCENVAAAVAFLKEMTSEEVELNFLYTEGMAPIIKCDIDESKLNELLSKCLKLSGGMTGLTPWWDRAFSDVGVEYNNAIVAIATGVEPQTAFDDLQFYAEQAAE